MNVGIEGKARRDELIERLQRLDELELRRCNADFAMFMRAAWHVLERKIKLVWNWHLDLVCGHLQDVAQGLAGDTVLNEPPGCSKSYTLVFWCAWVWGPLGQPDKRFMCASHNQALSTRDNLRVRDLVQSSWYQARWPDVELREDQNQKMKFATTQGGWRMAISVGQGIGEHPHYKVIDDAHDPRALPTDKEREEVRDWYKTTMSARGAGVDMGDGRIGAVTVLSGQRVHEDDLSAHVIAEGKATLVCLPMRYEPGRMKATPTGRIDPRTQAGELLDPKRFPEHVVKKLEIEMGSLGSAAQLAQRPAPLQGLMFKGEWLPIVQYVNPKEIEVAVRFWDVAGTEAGDGPRTAGVLLWRLRNGALVVADVVTGRWSDDAVEQVITAVAHQDGRTTLIREEQEPGSAGKAVVQSRGRLKGLEGFDYKGLTAVQDKVTRARPVRAAAEGGRLACLAWKERSDATILDRHGNVLISAEDRAKWIAGYIDELKAFPVGKLKDQVDGTSGAVQVVATEKGTMQGATW